jgi:hypothetical protein
MIKKYAQFIAEKLGVPEGNIEAAEELLDIILETLDDDATIFSKKGHKLSNKLNLNMKIGELLISTVDFEIATQPHPMAKKPVITGMSVAIPPAKREGNALIFDKNKLGNAEMKMMVIARPSATMRDLKATIEAEIAKYSGILSHELKHIYDKFMIGKELVGETADYYSWSRVKTGFGPIDKVIYHMYVMSRTESLVRPSEIAGEIKKAKVKKSEFMRFLESTSLYETLKEIKSDSAAKLKAQLLEDMPEIRSLYEDIPEGETDDAIAENVLNMTYKIIVEESLEAAENILGLANPLMVMLGKIKKEDAEIFHRILSKRTFDSGYEYFDKSMEEMAYQAGLVIKKIGKLYDLCEDDAEASLMSKIGAR